MLSPSALVPHGSFSQCQTREAFSSPKQYRGSLAGYISFAGNGIPLSLLQKVILMPFDRSLSFYPQPVLNWRRKSTQGLAIDFPICNVLGFIAYTISTSAFLYSPTIRSQYAYRHPASPEPTVRFNDFLFATHAVVICIITYSQFWTRIWGFNVGARQKASRVVLGIFWGSLIGVSTVVVIVQTRGIDGGYDPSGWAWVDVVSLLARHVTRL